VVPIVVLIVVLGRRVDGDGRAHQEDGGGAAECGRLVIFLTADARLSNAWTEAAERFGLLGVSVSTPDHLFRWRQFRCPDLVVLDLRLPKSGSLLDQLLREGQSVIVVSREAAKRERAYERGCYDALPEEVMPTELARRAARILESPPREPASSGVLKAGPAMVDLGARRVWWHGEAIRLTRQEFDLLVILVKRPGEIVEKQALLALVWGDSLASEDLLHHGIRRLRQALRDRRCYVVNCWGYGYGFFPAGAGLTRSHSEPWRETVRAS
jgi:DNA-binding response OmpR family regulator